MPISAPQLSTGIATATLVAVVAGLSYWGAGMLPGSLPAAVTGLAAGAVAATLAARRTTAAPEAGWLLAGGACLGLAVAATTLPWPNLPWLAGATRYDENQLAAAAWREAVGCGLLAPDRQGGSSEPWFALTRNRAGSLRVLLELALLLLGLGLFCRLRAGAQMRLLGLLVGVATVVAVAGHLGQWWWPQGKTLWWRFPVEYGRPVACFVNRNHFAGFAALFCPAALVLAGLALAARQWGRLALWTGCFAGLSLALFASFSRGAWLAGLAGILVAVLGSCGGRQRAVGAGVAGLAGLAFVALGLLSHGPVGDRLRTLQAPLATESGQYRLHAWRNALAICPDYPLLGAGADAFRVVFLHHKTTATTKSFYFAENEYVQWLVEGGIAGTVLGLALAGLWAWAARRAWQRGELTRPRLLIGGGALAVAGVHAAFDFAPRIPLYALAAVLLAAFLLPPAPETHSKADDDAAPPPAGSEWARYLAAWGPLAVPLLLLAYTWQCGWDRQRQLDDSLHLARAEPAELAQALLWAPSFSQVWYNLARAASQRPGLARQTATWLEQAVLYDPDNRQLWEVLAQVRRQLGDAPGAKAAAEEARRLRNARDNPFYRQNAARTPGPTRSSP